MPVLLPPADAHGGGGRHFSTRPGAALPHVGALPICSTRDEISQPSWPFSSRATTA